MVQPVPGSKRVPEGSGGLARRALQDSPRVIISAIIVVALTLIGLIRLARRSTELDPDYLSEVVLYALSAACLVMLLALAFLLARHVIKIIVEHRRAVPFTRFRAKLVAAIVGMTLIPSLLVLIVGSEVILRSAERWFSAPIDDVLSSANTIARSVYLEQQEVAGQQASRVAARLLELGLKDAGTALVRQAAVVEPPAGAATIVVTVYRVADIDGAPVVLARVAEVASPFLPPGYSQASTDALATGVAAGTAEFGDVIPLVDGTELIRGVALVRVEPEAPLEGVVVASAPLSGDLTQHARRINAAYEAYNQLRVLTQPVAGVYLSFFLMATLMILVAATWLAIYIGKRIVRPVLQLADGARRIGTGQLDHRIVPQSSDEFGAMVEAFNGMAEELSLSRERLVRSRGDLERKTRETERRRRYIETILERIATGVVSVDSAGRLSTINPAAARLLDLDPTVLGQLATEVFERQDLAPLGSMLRDARRGALARTAREVALDRDGREFHLAVAATSLPGQHELDGVVMVFDDVTPLFRAQRVSAWRDVARRLAHEIKNPLTPIQLCAERLRRNLAGAPPQEKALVDECTGTIVGEVEVLKGLVDEFSHFARLPSPRTVPADLNGLLEQTLALYDGLFPGIGIRRVLSPTLPAVRVDPEQIQRVVVNLVDNAMAALGGEAGEADRSTASGLITIETAHDPTNDVARVMISDTGPGIADADREKLFLPYFSTKGRGSGLGLAIVRRIVVEHGGSIEVADNEPIGTRFTLELPCASEADALPAGKGNVEEESA